jgi:allantoinase
VAALVGGDLDLVSSDHSPAPPALKLLAEGDFLRSWGGISSLQFSLAATWTAVRERGATLAQLAEWWSVAPALLTGLHNKGAIQTGKDADFVVWQPEENVTLDRAHPVFHRHAVHPYQGRTLQGRVLATFLRGELVFDGTQHSRRPCGRPLIRGQWEGYQLKMN